jgi:DNA-binding response OmpR family regulator
MPKPKKPSRPKAKEFPQILRAGEFTLHVQRRELTKGKKTQKLTPMQCRLLATFMKNGGQVLSRKTLDLWCD